MTRDFLTISNLLSLSRIPLVALFAIVMFANPPSAEVWALGILLLAMLTDKLDGDLARRLGQESVWGRILDPLADKIGVAVVSLVLLVLDLVPMWFVALLVIRDVVILIGGVLLRSRLGVILPSNTAGKWTVGVIAVTLILALLRTPHSVQLSAQVIASAMAVLSLVLYGRSYSRTRRGRGETA
jgi:CDP-diacylglycerol--glycerol-3-phosphate 3-phosphatidyltransferase